MADADALEIAADWADRIDELDAAERRRLITWLNESEAHVRAFSRMHMLLRDPALLEVLQALETPNAAPLAFPSQQRRRSDRRPRRVLERLRGARLAAIAAGLAAAVAVPLLLLRAPAPPPGVTAPPPANRLASAVGQRRVAQLADGSTVTLDAASAVRIAFAPDARPVTLERGAARFDVAHDAARPFSVATARARFTALGTSFSVDQLANAVELRVYRGRVRVDQAGRAPVVVMGGEWIRLGAAPSWKQRLDVAAGSEWNDLWLNAEQMRLDAALERIARYSATPIRLADPGLGAQRFSGRFRLDSPEKSAALIGALFGLAPKRQDDGIVLARR